jgi:hypothetical protein
LRVIRACWSAYSVGPANGGCEPATVPVSVFDSECAHLVPQDGAVAYRRLGGEEVGVARNDGARADAVPKNARYLARRPT